MRIRKLTAIILSVVMLVLTFPVGTVGAVEADNSQQIIVTGGESQTPDERIEISKTVSATEDENYFDITLTVTQNLPSTDIVLVMDISNTMNQNHNGQQTDVVADKRLTKAKNAAKAFIDEYSKTTGICKNRRIGMVQFNTNASEVFPLGNVNENINSFKADIDAIVAPPGNERFTNIEAGLQLAANMLASSTADQKYIILITDGFPTTYIESGRNSTTKIVGWDVTRTYKNPPSSTPTSAADGLFWDFVRNVPCNGTSYSDTAAVKAREVATEIKNDGINIFTIGVDISNESQTIQRYINATGSRESIVERTGNTYEVGSATDSTAYKNWLGQKIGGGPDLAKANVTNAFAQGDTVDQLSTAFSTVLDYVLGSEPVSVTDPMGDNIEFLGLYSKNGNVANSLSGTHAAGAENTATYSDAISWDLSASGYSETTTASATIRTYSLKYKVRLTNEADGFIPEKSYATNGRTYLRYTNADNTAGTLDFTIPSTEGYLGSLEINKTDSASGDKLEGAEFTLVHSDNCSVCGADVEIDDFVVVTDADGKATIASIPSGHEYELSETVAPEGYDFNPTTYAVKVAYGKTYVDSVETSSVDVKNIAFEPAFVNLSGQKNLSGGDKTDADILAGQFTFSVSTESTKGVSGVPAEVETAAGGAIDFGEWKFTLPGTYTFNISENNLGNAGYGYDGAEYVVKITVLAEDGRLVATTEIFKNGVEADAILFTNSYTSPEAVSVTAPGGSLTLTENGADKPVKDGQFSVTMNADPDNNPDGYEASLPFDSEVNTDGDFTLGDISFKKPGTYSFTVVQEDKGAAGYTYDSAEYVVTYTVTLDETTNELVVSDPVITKDNEEAEGIVFNNLYETPAPAELPVTGVTTLTGGGKTNSDINEGLFGYVIDGADQENVSDVPETIETAEGGVLDFGTWKFSEVGEYTFTVNENTPPAGYTDETGEVTVTVTVVLNEETNKLEATAEYSSGENIRIDNSYVAPDPITVELDGKATLGGQKTNDDIAENDFTFRVWEDENNNADGYTGFDETAGVEQGGAVDFGSAEFSQEGVYQFAITEDNGGRTGYVYDEGTCYVTVTVTLDKSTNTLVSETVITKDGQEIDEVLFENEYIPVPLTVEVIFSKNVIGWPYSDSEFTFAMAAADSANPLPEGNENGQITATVTGEGEISFGEMTFTQPGVYTYTVSEIEGETFGYIYDDTVYEVTYTVTDDEGVLNAVRTVTVDGETVEETEFTNVYVPLIPIIPIVPVVPPVFPPIIGLPDELPDVNLPDVELPDINLPDIDLPDFDIPGFDGGDFDDGNNGAGNDIDDEIPNTGSEDAFMWYALLTIVLASVFILCFKRKRTE